MKVLGFNSLRRFLLVSLLSLSLVAFSSSKVSAATVTVDAAPTPSSAGLQIPAFGGATLADLSGTTTVFGSGSNIGPGPAVYGWEVDPASYAPCSEATLSSIRAYLTISGEDSKAYPSADVVFAGGSGGVAVLPTTITQGDLFEDDGSDVSAEFVIRGEHSVSSINFNGDIDVTYTTGISSSPVLFNLFFDSEVSAMARATAPTIELNFDDSACAPVSPTVTPPVSPTVTSTPVVAPSTSVKTPAKTLAETGTNLSLMLSLAGLAVLVGLGLKKIKS